VLFVAQLAAAESPRERLSLDAGWTFHLGDDWPGALRLDKAGASSGPASDRMFSDAGWQLQAQTNNLGVGLGTNWINVSASTQTNQMTLPINATGAVFFRLVRPY